MATRSRIGKLLADGTVRWIYCHWNGDPSSNGEILARYWTDESKIDALLELGAISSLGETVGEKTYFDTVSSETRRKQCVAYHRDRGEEKQGPDIAPNPSEFARRGEEFNYLFTPGKGWTWKRPSEA